jgi:YYY domain-containing protein
MYQSLILLNRLTHMAYILAYSEILMILLIAWWFSLQVLGLIALPLTSLLLEPLPLKGYAFTKTVGLLVVGYCLWLLATFGWARFNAGGLLLAGAVVLVVGWWAAGISRVQGLLTMVRTRWAAILGYEALFAALLLGGLWLRWHGAVGAAIIGTEKPMDLTFLSGLLHSGTFPPRDPWLAGYAINYYYLGYFMVALLAVATGAHAGVAFTLGLATIFALTGLTVAGLVVALLDQARQHAGERTGAAGTAAAALLGIVFVLLLGNQAGAWQAWLGTPQVVAMDGRQLMSAAAQRLAGHSRIEIDPPVQTSEGDFGTISTLAPDTAQTFNWWWPSRAVWDEATAGPSGVERGYNITEFPFFSFYLGDLHPHVLSLPFNLVCLALALAALTRPRPLRFDRGACEWLVFVIPAIALGSLYAINSWDAPSYILLYTGALVLGYRRRSPDADTFQVLRKALPEAALVIMGAVLAVSPFVLTFQSFAGGGPVPRPWADLPLVGRLAATVLPARDHTDLHEFISMFGLFMLTLLAYAAVPPSEGADATQVPTGRTPKLSRLPLGWLLLVVGLLLGLLLGMPLLALLPIAMVCARAAWRSSHRPDCAFVLWATAVGALIVLGADVVYLRDPFENRMNTIFKLYYQAWLMWGTAAAFAAWSLGQAARRRPVLAAGWGIPALLLALGALVYPVATLGWGQAWISGRPVLDGLAFMQEAAPDEAAALAWIARNTRPDDVVLTAVGRSYDDSTGRVAAATGRATLLGWSGSHERLWRRRSPDILAEIEARERDVPVIYTTPHVPTATALLEHYGVDYVFVGPAERRLYAGPGLDKFDAFLEPVFEEGEVRVYRCPWQRQPIDPPAAILLPPAGDVRSACMVLYPVQGL